MRSRSNGTPHLVNENVNSNKLKSRRHNTLTSSSQSALNTFSSKDGSTKLGVPLFIVEKVSRRSIANVWALSRQDWCEVGDLVAPLKAGESVLERVCEELWIVERRYCLVNGIS